MQEEVSYEHQSYEDLSQLEHLILGTVLLVVDYELRVRNENRFRSDQRRLDIFVDTMKEGFLRYKVFQKALKLSSEQTDGSGFSQIKVRLLQNYELGVHTEWIDKILGYEFGFLIMIYRHAACCFEADIAHTEENKMILNRKAEELRLILERCAGMRLGKIYEHFWGNDKWIPDFVQIDREQDRPRAGVELALPSGDKE